MQNNGKLYLGKPVQEVCQTKGDENVRRHRFVASIPGYLSPDIKCVLLKRFRTWDRGSSLSFELITHRSHTSRWEKHKNEGFIRNFYFDFCLSDSDWRSCNSGVISQSKMYYEHVIDFPLVEKFHKYFCSKWQFKVWKKNRKVKLLKTSSRENQELNNRRVRFHGLSIRTPPTRKWPMNTRGWAFGLMKN